MTISRYLNQVENIRTLHLNRGHLKIVYVWVNEMLETIFTFKLTELNCNKSIMDFYCINNIFYDLFPFQINICNI